jgi:hypothetical protein
MVKNQPEFSKKSKLGAGATRSSLSSISSSAAPLLNCEEREERVVHEIAQNALIIKKFFFIRKFLPSQDQILGVSMKQDIKPLLNMICLLTI